MNKVFAVGVGPGSPKYVTDIVKEAISQCDVVIGYGYTIKTIEEYVKGKKILEVTMQNQEEAYQEIAKEDNHTIFCLLYTSPSPRDKRQSRMPSSA